MPVAAGRRCRLGRRDPRPRSGRADIDAERVALDIADEAAVRETFAALGPVDHLVLSPVARAGGPAKSIDLAAARTAFETKFWEPFAAVQAAEVRESIVFVTGVAAATPMRGGSATAAVNGALEALVRTLAVELAPQCGSMPSRRASSRRRRGTGWPPRIARRCSTGSPDALPAGRVGAAEDIAAAIWLLLTNGFVTGIVLPVDGGHRLAAP